MTKLIITGRRRPGLTRAGLSRHLREVHGPMVVAPPTDCGQMPSGYVQNHVVDGSYPAGGDPAPIDRDFVTELWFPSARAAGESVRTPYYMATLQPDEPNFVSQASVLRCFAEEEVVLDDPAPGHRKLFLFMRAAGGDNGGFRAAWRQARGEVLGSGVVAAVRRWVANVTLPLPGHALPYDGIDELWLHADAEAPGNLIDALLVALGDHVDRSGVFHLLADEYTTAHLLSLAANVRARAQIGPA